MKIKTKWSNRCDLQFLAMAEKTLAGGIGDSAFDRPVDMPLNWVNLVNAVQIEEELEAVRRSVTRTRPYGSERWRGQTAQQLGLQASTRTSVVCPSSDSAGVHWGPKISKV